MQGKQRDRRRKPPGAARRAITCDQPCRPLIFALLVAFFGSAGLTRTVRAETDRPNVILLVADDVGWADVGYHNPEMRTPHLDSLARSGLRLEQHYVQPECTPTRVALMTGRYPSRFGIHAIGASNEQAYPAGTLTMARLLKQAGYDTAIVGKWHMGSRPEWGPLHHGFDHAYGSLAGAVGMYDHRYRLDSPYARTWHRNHTFIDETGHATDLVCQEAVRWIQQPRTAPFFLYVAFHAAHTPLVEEPKWLDLNRHIDRTDRQLFAASVSHMDWAVGQIVDALDKQDLTDRTLILFTSDNGAQVFHRGGAYPPPDPPLADFSSNQPLRGRKTETYEGGIRVPAFMVWPDRLAPREITTPIHAVDWLPTLAARLGMDLPDDSALDGVNVWPVLGGSGDVDRSRPLYWVWGRERDRIALRWGDWKLVRPARGAAWELYNLAQDPFEADNRAVEESDLVAQLRAMLENEQARDAP
jgi:arylsulfatase A-like enzyme